MTAQPQSPIAPASRALAVALGLGALAVGTWAAADAVHTASPSVVVVGSPRGAAPSDRLGPQRRGRSSQPLPRRPKELWRRQLLAGLEFLPLVGADGAITAVLSNRQLVRLDATGRERWRARLGGGGAAVPPVLTSAGAVAVLGTDGRLRTVGSTGKVRRGLELALRARKAEATPLALDDGGLVVAGERQLVRVDGDGRAVARAELSDAPVGGLIAWQTMTLATLQSGEVVGWRPPEPPRTLGQLGGVPVGGAVLVGSRTLAAVIDSSAVLALDLHTGRTKLLAGGPGSTRQFEGPVTSGASGLLLATTVVGELLAIDSRGVIARRVALENAALILGADGGAPLPSVFRRLELQPSPPLVVDGSDRVAFVRASGRLGVLAPTGLTQAVHVVTARFCGRPLGLVPAGAGTLLVACRNGSLGMFGDGGA